MPDLSHRPTRYATAAVLIAAAAAVATPHVELRERSDARLAAERQRSAELQNRLASQEQAAAAAARYDRSDLPPKGGSPGADRAAVQSTRPDRKVLASKTPFRVVAASSARTLRAATVPRKPSPEVAQPARATGVRTVIRTVRNQQPNCATYPHQEAAQRAFIGDRVRLRGLDGDGDGRACEQLKSERGPLTGARAGAEPRPPEQEPPTPVKPTRPRAPSKADLLASGHHFGLMAATTEEYDAVESALKRDTSLHGFFSGWDTPYNSERVTLAWQRGEVPVMTWESRPRGLAPRGVARPSRPPHLAPGEVDTTDYSLRRIAGGAFDDYLTTYARSVKELGLPVFIRLNQEMNGNWYRWSEFEDPYGNEPGDFARAWRHVHDIFEAAGANAYASWIWAPNRVDNLGRFPAIDSYYPGADYVDWVGMSGYFRPGDAEATFAGTYGRTLAELRRVAPGKPILLAEIGATEDGGLKAAWSRSLLKGLPANPDIVGFVWFNYSVSEDGHTNDWRVTSSADTLNAVARGLADIGYGRPIGTPLTLIPAGERATAGAR